MFEGDYRSTEFPRRFQQESLLLVNGLLPLTSSAFYLVDPNMQHKGIVLSGVDEEMDEAYRLKYNDVDPAHPRIYEGRKESVVFVENLMSASRFHNSVYYKEFLKPRNIEHIADMYFRHEGKIVAVLSMLRDDSLPRFNDDDMKQLHVAHRFMEYSINTVYLPERLSQREAISEKYQLTDRELDVLEWILSGAENKAIAEELQVSLATIKTHLHHMYNKAGVTSRTQLLAKVYAAIGQ